MSERLTPAEIRAALENLNPPQPYWSTATITGESYSIMYRALRELLERAEDTERMDWVDGPDGSYQQIMYCARKFRLNMRSAIDAARKEDNA